MSEPILTYLVALTAIAVIAGTMLVGWQGWLRLKERELDRRTSLSDPDTAPREQGSPEGAARIELADLKERVRKLEAIANGVEL